MQQKSWCTDTQELEVAGTVIVDFLCGAPRNADGVSGADSTGGGVCDRDHALAGLDHVPLGHLKRMQFGGNAGFDPGARDRDLRAVIMIEELGEIAPLPRPDFAGFRFTCHSVDNTPISGRENIMANAPSIDNLLNLSGETVLVTGASGNIGQAIAGRLSGAGATILAHYNKNKATADALIERLEQGQVVQADLADAKSVEAMLAAVRPTALVHNAALQTVQSLATMSLGDWRAMMAANLDSAFLLTQSIANRWTAEGRRGAIVTMSSIEGMDPARDHAHYATSKAGLAMLTRAAALEFGAAGIRINSVSPGLIDRDGLADDWPDGVQRWMDRVPLGRLGTPNDVADAVLFLISPAARWISGANLVVDGGMSAQGKW